MITTILPPTHTTPETAFVVADYPYGFTLRCKIRFWLETNKKGTRFCSQTTNPRTGNVAWNKPKASTYSSTGAMYLDEKGHVQWESLNPYAEIPQIKQYVETFGENATNIGEIKKYLKQKEILEEELSRFTPRPEYGTALFHSAYLSARSRFSKELQAA